MSTQPSEKAQAFMMHIVKILNNGALTLMISLGHRTGLFDTLATIYPEYVSSQALADKAKLNERYVREWLGALVIGDIVEYNSESKTYRLPQEHSQFLTRASGPQNLAIFAQYIAILGSVENGILECFKNGGGLQESEYPRIQEVMAEERYLSVGSILHTVVLPGLTVLHDRLNKGSKVLDVGCGRGQVIIDLAKTFPNSTFVGYDRSTEAVAVANADVASAGLTNISFRVQDISKLKEAGEYDVILAMHTIHDLADPVNALKGIHRALKADGVFIMQDVGLSSDLEKNRPHPFGTAMYSASTMCCVPSSLVDGGPGLGACWGTETALKMLKENGFSKTEDSVVFPHDPLGVWFISWK
ncbi:5925_t:CDS:1 [Paraglomus brasilianum]|uniref:5925_t:CDS:1 n=1 Tax=Paraglomus brasilianum TaxID=144538 RepID=A0A9N9A3A8_9GLOM|nr:5925_t:CDS:1 [Paraglomus brasilianum]